MVIRLDVPAAGPRSMRTQLSHSTELKVIARGLCHQACSAFSRAPAGLPEGSQLSVTASAKWSDGHSTDGSGVRWRGSSDLVHTNADSEGTLRALCRYSRDSVGSLRELSRYSRYSEGSLRALSRYSQGTLRVL